MKVVPSPLSFHTRTEGNVTWITLTGSVDLFSIHIFDNLLGRLCEGQGVVVVLDCAALKYLNSRGIASIYKHHHTCAGLEGKLILCNLNTKISQNLKLMGLDGVLEMVPDTAAAERLASGSGES